MLNSIIKNESGEAMSCCDHNSSKNADSCIRIKNGVIDEIRQGEQESFVTVTYKTSGEFGLKFVTTVTLAAGENTEVQDESGQKKSLKDLKEGMRIDAIASSEMTRSLPPQTAVCKIRILKEQKYRTTETRILMVDVRNHILYTGVPGQPSRQIKFTISKETRILSRRGMQIHLWNLRRGQFVRVQYADFQTSSIPPQTAAYRIQVL